MTLDQQGQAVPDVTEEIEVLYLDSRTAVCDGGGVLGHPRVFLAIDQSGQVECPYCSRRFIFAPDKAGTGTTMEIPGRLPG